MILHLTSQHEKLLGLLRLIFFTAILTIYVEDEDQENLYTVIFNKILPKDIKFTKIIPLCGKDNMISHHQDPTNQSLIKNRIYILDKDFDNLKNTIINSPELIYLDRYCIENYLCESDAFVDLVIESNPKIKKQTIQEKLNMPTTLENTLNNVRNLFELFYAVQVFDLELKNCKSKPELFTKRGTHWKLNDSMVNDYKNQITNLARLKFQESDINAIQARIREQLNSVSECHKIAGGKFVLGLLFHYVKSNYNLGSITFESFVYRLAKNCSLESMQKISRKISLVLTSCCT